MSQVGQRQQVWTSQSDCCVIDQFSDEAVEASVKRNKAVISVCSLHIASTSPGRHGARCKAVQDLTSCGQL